MTNTTPQSAPATAAPKTARVSVLMPVYNAGRYLPEAVESILGQTFGDFVLYLLNDGSTDGSLEVLRGYEAKDARVRVVSHENRGLIATLNDGIALTDTEYIARMDSDDVALPERFAEQVAYLDAHPECVAVGCFVELIDSEGMPLCTIEYPRTHAEVIQSQRARINSSVIAHPTAMIRKSAVDRVHGYSPDFPDAEDIDFFLRLGETGELGNVPLVLLKYRQHVQSIGYSKRRQQWLSSHAAAKAAIARRGYNESEYPIEETFQAQSVGDMLHKWVWWSIQGGNVPTARKHAWRLARTEPGRSRTWRALYCALRGR